MESMGEETAGVVVGRSREHFVSEWLMGLPQKNIRIAWIAVFIGPLPKRKRTSSLP
jgi:hypothetical protein